MFITSKLEIELGLDHMLIPAESVILVSRILKFIAQRDRSIQVMELILMAPLQMEDTLLSLSSMKGDQRTLVNDGAWSRPIFRSRRDRKPKFNYNFYYY